MVANRILETKRIDATDSSGPHQLRHALFIRLLSRLPQREHSRTR